MWVIFGLTAAALRAAFILMQERINMEPIALAIWSKFCCLIFVIPFIFFNGIPTDPLFYVFTILSACLWSIADVVMWRTIPIIGSGVFSRTIPISVILNFLLWFLIDPTLISKYLNAPIISALILFVLMLSTYFAVRLKKCQVTSAALKRMWFVIVSFVFGPLMAMLASQHAPVNQGAWGFVLFESLSMLVLWSGYIAIRAPITFGSIIGKANFKFGLMSGLIMACMVTTYIYALYNSDNPGYVVALISLEAVMISAVNRLRGRKDDSDIKAGLGIVACAIALILLKTQIQ